MSKIDDMRIRLGVEAKMSRRKQLSTVTWIKADWVSKPKGPDGMAGLQVERKRVR